jgi:glyoxylate reductase
MVTRYGRDFEENVRARHGLVQALGKSPEAEISAGDAAGIRALLTMGTVGASAALIDALPSLGLICCYGSDYEKVDLAAARRRGIVVTHSPGANASSVADLAIALLLASIRRVVGSHAFVRDGKWGHLKEGRPGEVHGLTGRRIGIVGLGDIGLRIARRIAAFETEVRYHNRRPRTDVPFAHEPSLLALALWADALVVAARADASNRGLIDARVLEALGERGHVVNISRGSIVDEPALIAALEKGTIAGAGLDVFAEEPHVPEALRALPNVVLSPHMAGRTHESAAAMQAMVMANLDAFLEGRPVLNPVPELADLNRPRR